MSNTFIAYVASKAADPLKYRYIYEVHGVSFMDRWNQPGYFGCLLYQGMHQRAFTSVNPFVVTRNKADLGTITEDEARMYQVVEDPNVINP